MEAHNLQNEFEGFVHLNESDNVVIVTDPRGLKAGETIRVGEHLVQATSDVPQGHKRASRGTRKGEAITKDRNRIAVATQAINPGEHTHVHNATMPVASQLKLARHSKGPMEGMRSHFLGYRRKSGEVGVRNFIVVAASVNCSATVVKAICQHFRKDLSAYGIDGVIPVCNPAGCTQVEGGEYHQLLNRSIAGWVYHPNVVGAVVVGLGCEGTAHASIAKHKPLNADSISVSSFSIQKEGGTATSIRLGIAKVEELLSQLPKFSRERVSVSKLRLALNCGGSDAFSALTANPALGIASDAIVQCGGTVALAEIPECHGAEELLKSRAVSEKVEKELSRVFDWWDGYASKEKISLNDNLAVGNKDGGITTLIEKSLGAVMKAGSTRLTEVLNYASRITKSGFTIMNTPGYDPVSVTGLVAGGCQLVAFTTGRGSVYGCAIAPTVKIATRTQLFEQMAGDMDVDAGTILTGETHESVGKRIFDELLDVAEGKKTCSETLGLGWEEFLPWAQGELL